jgi:DNA polymerase III subunit epsilon
MFERLKAWWQPPPATAPTVQRWVVLDVESSGLQPRSDRLLAIAAIGVQMAPGRAAIDLGDCFEVVPRQPPATVADKPNILIHGIGLGAQRAGVDPVQALEAFLRFCDGAPLVAFHADFCRALPRRDFKAVAALAAQRRWLAAP